MDIAPVETVQGILRVRLLNRRVGDHRARQIGVAVASFLILLIAWRTVPWIAPGTAGQALAVGSVWLALLLAYDLGLGRLYFGVPWARIAADFAVRRGGYLGLGMLLLFLAPLLVAKFPGLF
ncbi:MAG: hypothetical protein PSW75_03905 [bacterium]|nr:hypothetical protein [bacterium]MDI1335200.1 hypothetical protein [Lacunisphaera sp.]